jgi:leucyl/phenylalanyl-tRNA--protein transferase
MPRRLRSHAALLAEMRRNMEVSDDGLVALGGALDPDLLEEAYRMGVFPWSSEPAVTWWCPDPRAIFELGSFRPSRSLRKRIRQSGWTFKLDGDFEGTIRQCAEQTTDRPATWSTEDFISAYCELHRRGIAHSVEVYEGRKAIGGLYGVAMGGFFGGESMFHRRSDASKAALAHLVSHLVARGFTLLDAQVMNPHLANLGAKDIPRAEYLQRLGDALALAVAF